MTVEGNTQDFLGISMTWNEDGSVLLHQPHLADEILGLELIPKCVQPQILNHYFYSDVYLFMCSCVSHQFFSHLITSSATLVCIRDQELGKKGSYVD